MSVKEFHLGDILSITTGRLVSLDHMTGVLNILNHLSGQSLFTHQLGVAGEAYADILLEQHPQLRAVQVPDEFENKDHVFKWLDEQVKIFGETLPVVSMPEIYDGSHAMADLFKMMGDKEVIVVEVPDGKGI